MRNPERIIYMMSVIEKIWQTHPDLRFNQLILNLQQEYRISNGVKNIIVYEKEEQNGIIAFKESSIPPTLFHVEDDNFIDFLERYLERGDLY